jgi:hypothetical protein
MKLNDTYSNISISHGTLIDDDIVEAIWLFNQEMNDAHLDSLIEEYEEVEPDDKSYILNEDIFYYMNDIAPPNCYFGAHPGNGSDIGFWEMEEEWNL